MGRDLAVGGGETVLGFDAKFLEGGMGKWERSAGFGGLDGERGGWVRGWWGGGMVGMTTGTLNEGLSTVEEWRGVFVERLEGDGWERHGWEGMDEGGGGGDLVCL